MNSSRIVATVILIMVVLFGSIWLGTGVATNQTETMLMVVGTVGFIICIFLGQRIWLLFLFLYTMNIPLIRGITSQEFGQFLLVGFSTLLFLMRKLKMHPTLTELDFWRIAVGLVILQVYLRNPVGLNVFGAANVGAKPYFIAVVSFVGGIILSKYRVDPREIKWTMWIAMLGSISAFPAGRLRGGLVSDPTAGNAGSVQVVSGGMGGGLGLSRVGSYHDLAKFFSTILVSRISPLRACFHPFWGIVLLAALAFAAASGYRNTVANVGLLLLVGIAYHGGTKSVIFSVGMGVLALGILAIVNVIHPLPGNIQRTLSPFPGTWETVYIEDAKISTDWRLEMWKEALFTEKWIKNKLIGDGLGFTREELEQMENMEVAGGSHAISGLTQQQESMMIAGGYHSGPVQTIRTVGYFGLLVMLAAMTRIAVFTHREIKRCRNTEWYPMMLFFGVPIIVYPIFFTLIFGTFSEAVAFIFLQSGFLELLRKNLPLPHYVIPKYKPYILMTARNRSALGRRIEKPVSGER